MKLELLFQTAQGTPKPTKLLFVHGICTGAWVWEKTFLPYFSQAGFDCYAVSLRGHAGSEGHEELKKWRLADYAKDIQTVSKTIQAPLIAIGHSLGGAVVQHWLHTGGQAKAAALLASVPPWGLATSAWRLAMTAPTLYWELNKLNTAGPQAVDADKMRHALFSNNISAEDYQLFTRRVQGESPVVGMEIQGFPPFAPMPWQVPPMFVLGGEKDQLIPADEVCLTASYYRTEARIIPNLSHSVMLDTHWEQGAKALLAWLNTVA